MKTGCSRSKKKASRRSRLILPLVLTVLTSGWIVTQLAVYFNFSIVITRTDNNSLDAIDTA